ncbi:Lipoxygenase [Bimuria novae-zelandiae CBS 107.79]|uniref:Manganese lipoxygenase n=1 Tax=Bimuria novae-zelandiae CBS 107.79 TaxID=1447943 RepID=A0A6A5W1G6_9PLEO|nr:Lipoxygenase [Bimuria novae-zelandiae CBS 107.79]
MSSPLWFILALCSTQIGRVASFTIPQHAVDPVRRKADINTTRAGFLYGPAVAGGPLYPTGPLGNAKVAADVANVRVETTPNTILVQEDVAHAGSSSEQYQGLDTVEEYLLLYKGQWAKTLPNGPAPGVLTNYSQDLFFSMERLTNNAFSVRRLPKASKLPFQVYSSAVSKVANSSLQQLLQEGRLFYADHRAQSVFPKTTNKFAAACDAYFYIAKSGQFLPLAVRTNVGANLVYTPADDDADWTLAKIMFNINDFFFAQTWHLASTHEVVQIAWMAAIRTLSVDHPIFGLLDRLTFQLFSIQPLAQSFLFDNGTAFDTLFPITGTGARDFTTELYFNGTGAFQAGYFKSDLKKRGLLNGDGPKLAHFPFYENAAVIHGALRDFMHTFISSYYKSDDVVRDDKELQAWATEANGPAKAIDFPTKFDTRDAIIDALTHIAHLSSTVHHSVNTNNLLQISATLPMHPASLYKPVPTTKGDPSVAAYLPPLQAALAQFQVDGLFARPLLANTTRSLAYMFDSPTFLNGTNDNTRTAANKFKQAMQEFSKEVRARTFDKNGLSQGAPFLWKALDPLEAPFSLTI